MTTNNNFDRMDYGTSIEDASDALAWIVDQGSQMGQYIAGAFTDHHDGFATTNPANGEVLALITQASGGDVDQAVTAAAGAQPEWAEMPDHQRARILYAIARLMQKNARLFALLETLDNGKPIRESRECDIPQAVRQFEYHAGLAQLKGAQWPEVQPLGVCGQIIAWTFPLLMLASRVAPAIAMGNACVVKPAGQTSLTALLFAEICDQAGLPKGVLNIVTGDHTVDEMLAAHPGVDHLSFGGDATVGRQLCQISAGSGKGLSLELSGPSAYLVFEDADLDSAVAGLVEAIWPNQGQIGCAGARLLVQESIAEPFYGKLRRQMDRLRVGNPLDKCTDIGAVIEDSQLQERRDLLAQMSAESGVYQAPSNCPETGGFLPATLITDLRSVASLRPRDLEGPVLCANTFRSSAEAITLANNSRDALAASIWSENINLALEVAQKVMAGVVWVNASHLSDAAAGVGGVRESGFGRHGGWEGASTYTKPQHDTEPLTPVVLPVEDEDARPDRSIGHDAKFYIGGQQTRPGSDKTRAVFSVKGKLMGHVGCATEADLCAAIAAANAVKGWGDAPGLPRGRVLFEIGATLSQRGDEIARRLNRISGKKRGKAEVRACVERLFTYSAWADKYDGQIHAVPIRGMALAVKQPVGVIGAFCPDEAPLLGMVSVMAPALAMGNSTVLVASQSAPLAACDFFQILQASELPAGVVNVLTGEHAALADSMAGHMGLDAVWSFSSADLSGVIERASASNLKRSWVNNARSRDWFGSAGQGRAFLDQACEVKNIWLPYGA